MLGRFFCARMEGMARVAAPRPADFRNCRRVFCIVGAMVSNPSHDILRLMFRNTFLLGIATLSAALAAGSLERRLYVTDRTGISVYDIDNGHTLVRKIDLP